MTAWRVPFVVGSAARLAYGLASVIAPEWMGGRFAPSLRGHPDPRMNLLEWRDRGKLDQIAAGGVAINIAGLTCWALAHAALREADAPAT